MGVVYLGHDPRLARDVAIKALPDHLAEDPDRLARFEREARTLASLNHPNVAGIYGVEEQEGRKYLVLEYVEGETLAERLDRGALAVDEALEIAIRIAAGVEAAHDAGVIHRDLKPANVKITPAGDVKVLDFGLARLDETGLSSSGALSESPTLTSPPAGLTGTTPGVILGTAAYMSPEQARGRSVDRRSDVWSFGVLLYEMLTGASPFIGETATDSIGAILHKDVDLDRLPEATPEAARRALSRCLVRDRNQRYRDIGDVRIELERARSEPASVAAAARRGSRIAWAGVAILAGVAGWLGSSLLTPAPAPEGPLRLAIERGTEESRFDDAGPEFAISPDGSMMAFVAGGGEGGPAQLYLRSFEQFEATALSDTTNAAQPFFSPDGRWIAFFADGKLKKVATSGGAAITLCDAGGTPRGGSWGEGGLIAFTPHVTSGIRLVSEHGGESRELTTPKLEPPRERSHRWPHFLPGGEALLFTMQRQGDDFDEASIEAVSVADGERRAVHRGGSHPKYARSGHLVFGRGGTLFACRFDPKALAALSSPQPVLEGVSYELPNGGVEYSISDGGALLFSRGEASGFQTSLSWSDRSGEKTQVDPQTFFAESAALSPDGTRVALQIFTNASSHDIWIFEIERAALSRLTFDEGEEMNPHWSPDGTRIAYASTSGGQPALYVVRTDGSEPPRLVTGDPEAVDFPASWSPDGARLAFHRISGASDQWDLWTVAVDEEGAEPTAYLASQFSEMYPAFSPDGNWMAYSSEETGRDEVYIRSYPSARGRWQVSIDGGTHPAWSPSGDEIFFWWADAIYSASVAIEGESVRVGRPERLFEHRLADGFYHPQFSVSPDGERLLLLKVEQQDEGADPALSLILNWFTELERLTGG